MFLYQIFKGFSEIQFLDVQLQSPKSYGLFQILPLTLTLSLRYILYRKWCVCRILSISSNLPYLTFYFRKLVSPPPSLPTISPHLFCMPPPPFQKIFIHMHPNYSLNSLSSRTLQNSIHSVSCQIHCSIHLKNEGELLYR